MATDNLTINIGLRDFNAAEMIRTGMIERFVLDNAGTFDLRIREISAKHPDVEETFDAYIDDARKDAFAAPPYYCHVHVFEFRVNHVDALGTFVGAYALCTMHLGKRLIGKRFEPAVTVPERFDRTSDRLYLSINRRWPPIAVSKKEQTIASLVLDQVARGFQQGYDIYIAPALDRYERKKLH